MAENSTVFTTKPDATVFGSPAEVSAFSPTPPPEANTASDKGLQAPFAQL